MKRTALILTLAGLAVLVSCSQENDMPAAPVADSAEDVRAEAWRENQILTGQEVYQAACASCHEGGAGDAPVTGNQESWSGRSNLWTAVLSAHATAGYLDMPEKGGHGELSDDEVSAAVEYMLLSTFPDMPRD